MSSDTPRTDRTIFECGELAKTSRTLERELTAAQARIAELERQLAGVTENGKMYYDWYKDAAARIRNMQEHAHGVFWYWQDDGEDRPESLGCPVVVNPNVVRRWVAAEAQAKADAEDVARLRWVLANTTLRDRGYGPDGCWLETDLDGLLYDATTQGTPEEKMRAAIDAARERGGTPNEPTK